MTEKLTVSEVEALFRDVSIPDSELRKYLVANSDYSRPFDPALRYDEKKVEITHADLPRTEAGVVSGILNGVARFRRKEKFINAMSDPAKKGRKVLVTEGDSWFQFPFLLDDVVDNLMQHYNVLSVGKAGDTTENMTIKNPEFIDAIDDAADITGEDPDGFVFSAGGNDFLGEDDGDPVFSLILREHASGEKFDPDTSFKEVELKGRIDLVKRGFRSMIKTIRREYEDLPIFLHAYDLVFPFDKNNPKDKRDPIYAAKDQWIAGPISKMGIQDPTDQRKVTTYLLGRFREILEELADPANKVHIMETGSPLQNDVGLWNDEIHPNDAGYRIVTNKFRDSIDRVL